MRRLPAAPTLLLGPVSQGFSDISGNRSSVLSSRRFIRSPLRIGGLSVFSIFFPNSKSGPLLHRFLNVVEFKNAVKDVGRSIHQPRPGRPPPSSSQLRLNVLKQLRLSCAARLPAPSQG